MPRISCNQTQMFIVQQSARQQKANRKQYFKTSIFLVSNSASNLFWFALWSLTKNHRSEKGNSLPIIWWNVRPPTHFTHRSPSYIWFHPPFIFPLMVPNTMLLIYSILSPASLDTIWITLQQLSLPLPAPPLTGSPVVIFSLSAFFIFHLPQLLNYTTPPFHRPYSTHWVPPPVCAE